MRNKYEKVRKIFPMINEEEKITVEKLINEHKIKIDNFHIHLEQNRYISAVFGNVDIKIKKYLNIITF